MRALLVTTVPTTLMFVEGQAAFMRARGIELSALSSPGEYLDGFGRRERVAVHAVEMPRRISPWRDLRSLWRMRRLFKSIRPDIVHSHTPKGGLLGMIAGWLAGVNVRVYHMHGLPFVTRTGFMRRVLWATEFVSCRLAHAVICVSPSLRQVAIDSGLCRAEKIQVLAGGSANGVDGGTRFNPDRYSSRAMRASIGIPNGAKVVGYVGRIVRDKGIVELSQAWTRLRAADEAAHLLLVGPAEAEDAIPDAIAAALRDDPRVHAVGMQADPAPFYAAMDLLVLPSYREGFGVVLIEAAAMRLPVVATRIAGVVDAVAEGETGTLIPPGDADALYEAIALYLRDPALRAAHGLAGRRRVLRAFQREVIWEALYSAYVRLLEQRSGGFVGRSNGGPCHPPTS